jgi:hypothetical protein
MERKPHQYEFTGILKNKIWHYTCNAPSLEVLTKHNITAYGEEYGCDAREILLIPKTVYEKQGISIDKEDITIQTESLLSKLK